MIRVRGARQHNLKNFDLELPRGAMTVVTGVSGSGKSSLAFDTLYAEGQRRYVESVSTYARQFLERLPRPEVDSVTGLSPAVAIQQSNRTRSARSTVGTATEIYDFLRLLFARAGTTFCPRCGRAVVADSPDSIGDEARAWDEGAEVRIFAPVALPPRLPWADVAQGLRANGYLRVAFAPPALVPDGPLAALEAAGAPELVDLDPLPALPRKKAKLVLVLIDRFRWKPDLGSRLAEALESAFARGEGRLLLQVGADGVPRAKSERWECPTDGLAFLAPRPNLFSFNSPLGVCPTCRGFGDTLVFDPALVIPDAQRTLSEGAIDPWAGSWRAHFAEKLRDLRARHGVPLDVAWAKLSGAQQELVLEGGAGFKGVLPFLRRLQEKSYRAGNRFIVKRYQRAVRCPHCAGARLRPEALCVQVGGRNIAQCAALTLGELLVFLDGLEWTVGTRGIAEAILLELTSRLRYLVRVDLAYLSLDRLARTLSGGEAQRIELANALGANLVDTLYVLDEPTIGLHPRDGERLLGVLDDLAKRGNTLVVVEHEPAVIRKADWVVDLGPGAGVRGGHLLYSGPGTALAAPGGPDTETARYLRGETTITRRRWEEEPRRFLVIEGAREHNLKGDTVRLPVGRFTCVTGVSGSGKSTLIEDILHPAARNALEHAREAVGAHGRITGFEALSRVVLVDQSPIGKSPRSNPLTYVKGFDALRALYARQPMALERGYTAGAFSFNIEGGRCETCQGDGVVAVEMYFLADLLLPCETCGGARYKRDVLEVTYRGLGIRQALDLTVEEAITHFAGTRVLVEKLRILSQVGLGYLSLGQAAPTLSGGEAQRLKIARELAIPVAGAALYLMDEPTVGLHVSDVQRLLDVLEGLLERGHTVVCVEHHLDVIRNADWVVDLGPGGGDAGGHLVVEGTPEDVAACAESWTGRFLATELVRVSALPGVSSLPAVRLRATRARPSPRQPRP
ncbi:MAG: excinuclease ABC subunit UvrA [Candidatus Eisenbacteria bacterium]